MLSNYYQNYKTLIWLFEGTKAGAKYPPKPIKNIFKKNLQKAKIKKHYTLHSFRHSLAIHLSEQGLERLRFQIHSRIIGAQHSTKLLQLKICTTLFLHLILYYR